MISFECDYNNGAHPKVLENLIKYNDAKPTPYGFDEFSERAKERIRVACGLPDAQIFFLTGGTQTNATTIDSMLYQYEGVICVGSGHINVHEAGAVELGGHKVIALQGEQGKLRVKALRQWLSDFYADPTWPHMVQPGMVYISFPTEYGTIYSKDELADIHRVCADYGLPLMVDGARLGYGLMCPEADITLEDLARLCDVFYIGGTKNGALFGEAIVFNDPDLYPDFDYVRKERGALLAKGWLLGAQFGELFKDNLYFKIAKHANVLAKKLSTALKEAGFEFLADSPTNQVFPIVTKQEMATLAKKYIFEEWQPIDEEHSAIRFVTSWATEEAHVDELIKDVIDLRR